MMKLAFRPISIFILVTALCHGFPILGQGQNKLNVKHSIFRESAARNRRISIIGSKLNKMCAENGKSIVQYPSLKKKLIRFATGFAIFTAGVPLLSQTLRNISPNSEFGSAISSRLVPSAEASIFKKANKFTLKEKLANVPAFAIVNRGGNFYLNIKEDGTQQGVFFTSYEDANTMLFEMLQSPWLEGDARILITPLDKAYELVKHPRATGGTNDMGEPEVIEFKFHEAVNTKESIAKLGIDSKENVAIPVFYADGLQIIKDGVRIKPIFFDVKDLYNAWIKAAKEDPSMPASPDIKVYDLPEIILLMEKSASHSDFGFFPSTSSIQAVKTVRSQYGTRARPMYRLAAF